METCALTRSAGAVVDRASNEAGSDLPAVPPEGRAGFSRVHGLSLPAVFREGWRVVAFL
jgi:hypothetical protein